MGLFDNLNGPPNTMTDPLIGGLTSVFQRFNQPVASSNAALMHSLLSALNAYPDQASAAYTASPFLGGNYSPTPSPYNGGVGIGSAAFTGPSGRSNYGNWLSPSGNMSAQQFIDMVNNFVSAHQARQNRY